MKMNSNRRLAPVTAMIFTATVVLLASSIIATAANGQSLLDNTEFDSDVRGWIYFGGPEAILRWDGTRGLPTPGSLQLASKQVPLDSPLVEAMSECFPVSPGDVLRAEAMVFVLPRGGDRCFVRLVFYKGPNCSGPRTTTGAGAANVPAVWERSTFTVRAGTSARTVRMGLALRLSLRPGLTICNFDLASLTRIQ